MITGTGTPVVPAQGKGRGQLQWDHLHYLCSNTTELLNSCRSTGVYVYKISLTPPVSFISLFVESLSSTWSSTVEEILILSHSAQVQNGVIPNKADQKEQAWECWKAEWHWWAWNAVPSKKQIIHFYLKHHSGQSTKEKNWKRSSLFGVFTLWEIGQDLFYC